MIRFLCKPRTSFIAYSLFLSVFLNPIEAQVNVSIQHPPFNQLSIEDLWKITLVNVSTATYAVNLKAALSENEAGLIANGTSTEFELPPGTRTFTAADYNQLNPAIEYVNPDPKYQESIVRTGGLPSGEYQICVTVNQSNNLQELGRQCIEQSVLMVSPPVLIAPEDGGKIMTANPSFLWTPVSGVTGVQNKFKLVEIFQGQPGYDAIKNNPEVYSVINPDETRFEYRPPDATMNPYFGMIAILLAGIDGVVKKIDPVKEGFGPYDKNFLEDDSIKNIQFLPRNLEEAMDALEADNKFLKQGNIFSDELLEQWVKVKREEVLSIGTMPHPFEYKMYFNL
jgi:hypothetical protein